MKRTISIRVDVDTYVGLKKGVPKLLNIFARNKLKATFFVVMGPDVMGKHMKRFSKKGYLKRILSVNPFRLIRSYGLLSFFYGTLLEPPLIGETHPDLLRAISESGHEVGIHGYNHALWADHYSSLTDEQVESEFELASRAYYKAFGEKPSSFAAPNWRSHEKLYRVEDKQGLLYASDLRGYYPFHPRANGVTYKTLQLPVNLPSSHECLQLGIDKRYVVKTIINELSEDTNVWTIHDWYEGMIESKLVEEFIDLARGRGYHFATMGEVAIAVIQSSNVQKSCQVETRAVKGGIGEVTWQGLNSESEAV